MSAQFGYQCNYTSVEQIKSTRKKKTHFRRLIHNIFKVVLGFLALLLAARHLA